jgi:peptide/nickel transport system ATP-binding protein
VPALDALPPGCRFQNRCPYRIERCAEAHPPLEAAIEGHEVACYRWREIEEGTAAPMPIAPAASGAP